MRELNLAAARLARECADECTGAGGRPVIVAGSVGPTGELLEPVGPLTHADATAAFEEQIAALIEGGADVIWAETMSSVEEFGAVAAAAANQSAPFCATLSFDTAGRTMMGVTSEAYAALAAALPNPPLAVGANFGPGASDLLRTVLGITGSTGYSTGEHLHFEIIWEGTRLNPEDYLDFRIPEGAPLSNGPIYFAPRGTATNTPTLTPTPTDTPTITPSMVARTLPIIETWIVFRRPVTNARKKVSFAV